MPRQDSERAHHGQHADGQYDGAAAQDPDGRSAAVATHGGSSAATACSLTVTAGRNGTSRCACSVAVTLFWGGWLRPFPNVEWLAPINFVLPFLLFAGSGASSFLLVKKLRDPLQQKVLAVVALLLIGVGVLFLLPPVNAAAIGVFWFLFKVALVIYLLIWFRGTFPRFRYDQLMNIGWKYMIPIGMGALMVNALLGML